MHGPVGVFTDMIEAFDRGDLEGLRACLADDLTSYVTNARGEVDKVQGADAYVRRLPDTSEAEYGVTLTQGVAVSEDEVLAMVEVRARRRGRELHNHAGFLGRVHHGRIAELWMVDALPAESDAFWA